MEVTVRVEGFDQLRASLRRYTPDARKGLDRELRQIAGTVASDVKSAASWSTRIPKAIGTVVDKRGAGIKVREQKAPHARVWEGSRGRRAARWPLFGDRAHWFTAPVRPFLTPAAETAEPRVRQAAEAVIHDVAQKANLA